VFRIIWWLALKLRLILTEGVSIVTWSGLLSSFAKVTIYPCIWSQDLWIWFLSRSYNFWFRSLENLSFCFLWSSCWGMDQRDWFGGFFCIIVKPTALILINPSLLTRTVIHHVWIRGLFQHLFGHNLGLARFGNVFSCKVSRRALDVWFKWASCFVLNCITVFDVNMLLVVQSSRLISMDRRRRNSRSCGLIILLFIIGV